MQGGLFKLMRLAAWQSCINTHGRNSKIVEAFWINDHNSTDVKSTPTDSLAQELFHAAYPSRQRSARGMNANSWSLEPVEFNKSSNDDDTLSFKKSQWKANEFTKNAKGHY